MKIWRITFAMLDAFSLASCKPSARQTAADAEQPTDSTEAVTSADALRLVITGYYPLSRGKTEPSMPSMILATNSLHTAPACSLST